MIKVAQLTNFLKALIALTVVCGFLTEMWLNVSNSADPFGLVDYFNLSYESNFPTWVSVLLLFGCSLTLFLISSAKKTSENRFFRHWRGLSFIFLYISLDEATEIHERANQWTDFDGFLYFGWVIPGSIVVTILFFTYLRFLKALPTDYRNKFVVAGAVYIGGALILEMILGKATTGVGAHDLAYGLLDIVEETMEMVGAAFFLVTLLRYLQSDEINR